MAVLTNAFLSLFLKLCSCASEKKGNCRTKCKLLQPQLLRETTRRCCVGAFELKFPAGKPGEPFAQEFRVPSWTSGPSDISICRPSHAVCWPAAPEPRAVHCMLPRRPIAHWSAFNENPGTSETFTEKSNPTTHAARPQPAHLKVPTIYSLPCINPKFDAVVLTRRLLLADLAPSACLLLVQCSQLVKRKLYETSS